MIVNYRIIENYVKSLLKIAKNQNILSDVNEQLNLLKNMLADSAKITEYLTSKIIDHTAKNELLAKLATECKLHKSLIEFLKLLIKNNRFDLLPAIIENYQRQIKVANNIKHVEIVSAKILTEKELNILEKYLMKKLNQQAEIKIKLEFETKIDKSLLGGVLIKYDSKLIDCSILGALDRIDKIISNAAIAR